MKIIFRRGPNEPIGGHYWKIGTEEVPHDLSDEDERTNRWILPPRTSLQRLSDDMRLYRPDIYWLTAPIGDIMNDIEFLAKCPIYVHDEEAVIEI